MTESNLKTRGYRACPDQAQPIVKSKTKLLHLVFLKKPKPIELACDFSTGESLAQRSSGC
jgi:hypothetical protein